MSRRSVPTRAFDRLERAFGACSSRAPRLAVAATGAVGWLRNALSRRWPAPAQVAALLGSAGGESARLSRRIAANAARNRLCARLAERGAIDSLRSLAVWQTEAAPASLRGPAILASFHIGAHHALALGLPDLPGPRLVIRWTHLSLGADGRTILATTHGGLERRAAALKMAFDVLRGGGVVITALDGEEGAQLPGRCLHRHLGLGAGALLLARRAGASLVPFTGVWERGRVRLELHPPLARATEAGGFEMNQARIAGEWLDGYLRRRPEQLGLGLLRRLLGCA